MINRAALLSTLHRAKASGSTDATRVRWPRAIRCSYRSTSRPLNTYSGTSISCGYVSLSSRLPSRCFRRTCRTHTQHLCTREKHVLVDRGDARESVSLEQVPTPSSRSTNTNPSQKNRSTGPLTRNTRDSEPSSQNFSLHSFIHITDFALPTDILQSRNP